MWFLLTRRFVWVLLAVLASASQVHATSYTLPLVIGSAPFGCTLASGTTYNCPASITLVTGDSVAASSASLTLNVNGDVTIPNNVTWGNSSFNINVVATGTVTLGNSNNTDFFGNITAATIVMGNNASVSGICTTNSSFSNSGNCAGGAFIANGCTSSTSGTVTTVTCTSNGTFTPPSGITLALVEAWGGGGGGGNSTSTTFKGGGGAGGQYAYELTAVSAGTSYNVVVGQGGGSATAGSDSTFSATTVVAKGGAAGGSNGVSSHGTGGVGSLTGGVGDFVFSGGNGAAGSASGGGGGGGGAGNTGNGGNASGRTGGTGNTTGGGNGGTGPNTDADGVAGSTYGGGGSGANKTTGANKTGGAGANGVVIITYSNGIPSPTADWRMDETTAYSGVTGEVKNSVSGGTNGTAQRNTSNPPLAFPSNISGKLCGGVQFNGFNSLEVTGLSSQLSGTASLSFWIQTTQASAEDKGWASPGVTGVEDRGGQNDIFWGWINPSGKIALNNANLIGAKSTSSIINGAWRHIVLTRNTSSPGESKVYVDGLLEATLNMADFSRVANAFSSIGRIKDTYSSVSIGALDEVKIFASVLTATQVASIYANESAGKNWDGSARVCPVSGPDHMEIIHPTGTGLTCTASTLTVRACANAACTTLYTGGVGGTLTATGTPTVNWDGTTGGATGAGFVIPAGSSSVTKSVQVTTVGSVVFGVTAPTAPAASNATTCNFGSPSCTFSASAAGFIFDVPHHVSEVLQTVNVSAVKSADNSLACVPAFASVAKNVTFKCAYVSPASGTLPVRVNGTALNAASNTASACDAAGNAVSLSFGPTGVASTSFQYADAGSVGLTATYTGSGLDAGLTMTGSDTFIAAPKDFAFSAIPASPIKAGSSFNATVTARNNSNVATPNFINQTVTITSSNPQPALGNATPISSALTGFSNGAASTNLVWNEVGTVDLNANLANYLSSGLSVSGVNAATGRFQPAYFDVSVTPGCGTFSYAGSVTPTKTGQPFVVTVKAKRLGGGATDATNTANYAGANAFVTTLSNAGAATGLSSNTIATTGFVSGVGTANVRYAGVNEKVSPTTLVIRAVDSDTPAVSSAGYAEGASELRSGRMRLLNAYGSDLLALPVPLETQYWNGSYFANNSADNCTAFQASSIGMGSYTGGLAACETQITPSGTLAVVAGKLPGSGLVLTKPGNGNGGNVNLTVNLGATASGNTCVSATESTATAANLPWLTFDWLGAGTTNPKARATFGIYKSPLIYRRENY